MSQILFFSVQNNMCPSGLLTHALFGYCPPPLVSLAPTPSSQLYLLPPIIPFPLSYLMCTVTLPIPPLNTPTGSFWFSPLYPCFLSLPTTPPPLYNNWKLRSACKQRVCSICLSEPGSLIQYDAFYLHLFSFKLHNFIFLSGSIMLCVPHFNIHPFVGGCFHSFAILKRTAINGGV